MKFIYLFAIICIYNANAFMHPEVLMTENMQFQPGKN